MFDERLHGRESSRRVFENISPRVDNNNNNNIKHDTCPGVRRFSKFVKNIHTHLGTYSHVGKDMSIFFPLVNGIIYDTCYCSTAAEIQRSCTGGGGSALCI